MESSGGYLGMNTEGTAGPRGGDGALPCGRAWEAVRPQGRKIGWGVLV